MTATTATTTEINNGTRARGRAPARREDRVVRRVTVSLNEREAYDLDHFKNRARRSIGEAYSDAEALRRAVTDWCHEQFPCDPGFISPDEIRSVFHAFACAETPEEMAALRSKALRMIEAAEA